MANTLYKPYSVPFAQQDAVVYPLANAACSANTMFEYHKRLEAWNNCNACGRDGRGSVQNPDGSYSCTAELVPGALNSCVGPVNPCVQFARPLPAVNPWEQMEQRSWGAPVFSPQYNTFILNGTWDEKNGRPYFADSAPYMLEGRNVKC